MLSYEAVCAILFHIEYKDWSFSLTNREEGGFLLQVVFKTDGVLQRGRKWYVSYQSTRSEVVQTALKAILTAEEHEARERFLYRGCPVYGAHHDVDRLVDLCEEEVHG